MALAGEIYYKLTADASGLNTALRNADRDAANAGHRTGRQFGDSVNTAVQNAKIDISSPLDRAFSSAHGAISRGGSRISSMMSGIFQGIGQTIAGIVANAVSSAIGSIKGVFSKVIELGSTAENLKISFRTIIGDAERADRLQRDLQNFAAATPYTSTQVTTAAQRLLTVQNPEQIVDTIRRLGDIAAGTSSQLEELSTVYMQVLSAGKLQSQDALQFATRGIPLFQALGKVMGKSVAEVREEMSQGRINTELFQKAIASLTDEGGKFNGIMKQQSETLTGLGSTFQDKLEAGFRAVYDKINPALVQMLKSLDEATGAASNGSTALETMGNMSARVVSFLKQYQPQINAAFVAMSRFVDGGLKAAESTSANIYGFLQRNPEVLKLMTSGGRAFGAVLNVIGNVAKSLAPLFEDCLNLIARLINKTNEWVESLANAVNGLSQATGAEGMNPATGDTRVNNAGGYVVTAIGGRGRSRRAYSGADALTHHSSPYKDQYGNDRRDWVLQDLKGRTNVPIPAPERGRVKQVAYQAGGAGNYIMVEMPNGQNYMIMHMKAPSNLKVGDSVIRGQILGIQGSTGRSTGDHIHMNAPAWLHDQWVQNLSSGNWNHTVGNNPLTRLVGSGLGAGAAGLVEGVIGTGGRSRGGGAGGSWGSGGAVVSNVAQNRAGFLNAIAAGESNGGKDMSVSTAGARGIYQFISSTRNNIKNRYGTDPWSNSGREQAAAAMNLIRSFSPQALAAIDRGDYATAARLLNTQWTSLPGGREHAKNSNVNRVNIQEFAPGGSRWQNSLPAPGGGRIPLDGNDPVRVSSVSPVKTPTTKPTRSSSASVQTEDLNQRAADLYKKRQDEARIKREAASAVSTSEINRLEAEARASGSSAAMLAVEIKREELKRDEEIERIRSQMRDDLVSPNQGVRMIQNTKATASANITRLRNDYKGEVVRQQEEQKRKAAELTAEQQRILEERTRIDANLTQTEIELMRSRAKQTTDLLDDYQAELAGIQQTYREAIADIERQLKAGTMTQAQASRGRFLAGENMVTASYGAKSSYDEAVARQAAEERQRQSDKGRQIQEAIARNRQARYDREDTQYSVQSTLSQSELAVLNAQASVAQNPDQRRDLNIAARTREIGLELANMLHQVDELGRSGNYSAEQLQRMRDNAQQIAQVKLGDLDNQFKSVGQTIQDSLVSNLGSALEGLLTGTKTLGEALSGLLNSMLSVLANMAVKSLFGGLFGGGIMGFATGGFVGGGGGRAFPSLTDAVQNEAFLSGNNPRLAVLNDGELVLNHKQVAALKGSGIMGFSSGSLPNLNLSPSQQASTSVSIGDVIVPGLGGVESEQLAGKLKGAIYEVLMLERRQGGLLSSP